MLMSVSPATDATVRPHRVRPAQRVEDRALLTGRGRHGDDAPVRADTLHAAVLRSPHAHARLLAVRTAGAEALPGVRAVLTGADVQRWSKPFIVGVKAPMDLTRSSIASGIATGTISGS